MYSDISQTSANASLKKKLRRFSHHSYFYTPFRLIHDGSTRTPADKKIEGKGKLEKWHERILFHILS
jgi:hypothetical protein